MKSLVVSFRANSHNVTLRVRVWIEIVICSADKKHVQVTLRVRVWIEICIIGQYGNISIVTLRVRVWIEINSSLYSGSTSSCHPPCEGVD